MSYHRDDGKTEAQKEAEHFVDVLHHFANYATHCFQRLDKHERDIQKMKPHLRALVPACEEKMQTVRNAVVQNQMFLRHILDQKHVFESGSMDYQAIAEKLTRIKEDKMSKVRSTIRQCVRDWAKEGAEERDQCYRPIMDELAKRYPDPADRKQRRVLIPGSGLSRLTWEVAHMGFFSQGNEFSYYMLLASYLILNCLDGVECLPLYPFVHETKNLLSVRDQLQEIRIPDVDPSSLPEGSQFSMVAGDFLEVFKGDASWDSVCTCFFIDTAHDILEYLEFINKMMKPGGYWINFGPLLYHYSGMGPSELSVDLTWEEIKGALPGLGFELLEERTDQPSRYTANTSSMLQQSYKCVFSVCRKVSEPVAPVAPSPTTADAAGVAAGVAAAVAAVGEAGPTSA